MIIDGLSAPEVAEKLGVKTGLLYRWKQDHLADLEEASASTKGASPTQMAAEIEDLRKRLAKAERINQILKKW
jgi:transposase-like protein